MNAIEVRAEDVKIESINPAMPAHRIEFSREQIELLKSMFCKDATDDEFKLFLHACQRTGLDPFMRQIHALKRWDSVSKKNTLSIQTGIDGYRLLAERTGKYMPGREPTFCYDDKGRIVSSTAYIKKMDSKGEWHEIAATAYFDEYAAKTKDGNLTSMWATRPRGQLAKCAEALVLRKAFPADLSGIYTHDEMQQADNHIAYMPPNEVDNRPLITQEQVEVLDDLIGEDRSYREVFMKYLAKQNISDLRFIPQELYQRCLDGAKKYHEKKMAQQQNINTETGEITETQNEG